jgi:hypothetical protein
MSLTPQDLQAIGDLIDQKLEQKLDEKLEEKLEQKFNQKLAPIKKELRKIKKTLDESISFFDREIVNHSHRLDRLENHVGLQSVVHSD